MDIKQREKEEIEQKISESLKRAKKGYGRLPFLFVYHDEWKDRKGYPYLGISTTWIDLNTWEMMFAAPCILHFAEKQTAENMSFEILKELSKFGICEPNIHCSLFDNDQAATGREIQIKTGCGIQPCVLHSLSKGIKRSCGQESYKAENEQI